MDLRGKRIEEGYTNLVTVEGDSVANSGKLQNGQGTDLGNVAVGGLSFNNPDSELGLPAGTTAERPSSPSAGYLRWNTTDSRLEVYTGTRWSGLSEIGFEQVALGVAQGTISAQDAVAVIGSFFGAFGTPASAFSVRQLGDSDLAMRVRRSSDNAEQNIGFDSNGDLDETALTTFVGANDGFVTTWYDQSIDNTTLPADYGSGATASYSLRKVVNSYTGNAIRVRRASDNTEQDIGFSNGELDTSSLETFCSGTNGFVTTWYDQSGSNDATQATAGSQPQIVSSGSTILENGKPAIDFDGTDDILDTGISSFTTTFEFSFVFNLGSSLQSNSGQGEGIYGQWNSSASDFWFRYDASSFELSSDNSTAVTTGTPSANQSYIGFTSHGSSTNILRINGQQLGTSTGSSFTYSSGNNLHIGNISPSFDAKLSGTVQEFIYYASDQSANRKSIELNQASYYDIGVSLGASQSTAGSQPKIVSSGTVIKENTVPAIDFDGTDDFLDTSNDVTINQIHTVFKSGITSSSSLELLVGDVANDTELIALGSFTGTLSGETFTYRDSSNNLIATSESTIINNHVLVTLNATDDEIYANGLLGTMLSTSGGTTTMKVRIGTRTSADFTFGGVMQEFIVYETDKSADRTSIESNIATYFNITI